MDQQGANRQVKGEDEKFCGSCGEIIKIRAEICPKCGVRQRNPLSKAALLIITLFLGGIGAHKFYLGKHWQGFFYLLFCWTGIPSIIAFVEFIIFACTSSETLQDKYESGGGGGVIIATIAGFFGLIAIVGILAAIAIPQFVAYRTKALQQSLEVELQNLVAAEHAYFSRHNTFSANLEDLDFEPGMQGIVIELVSADENCFEVVATHSQLPESMAADCNGVTYQEEPT